MKLSTTPYKTAKRMRSVFGYEPPMNNKGVYKRTFVAYFFLVGWDCISLGFHISFANPNIEIHLPFGFIRIGWVQR